MLFSLALNLAQGDPIAFYMQAAAIAQSKVATEHMVAKAVTMVPDGKVAVTYDMDINRAGSCSMTVTDPRNPLPPTRLHFLFGKLGASLTVYREDLKQFELKEAKKGDFTAVSQETNPELDAFVRMLVEQYGLNAWFDNLPDKNKFTAKFEGDKLRLELKTPNQGVVLFVRKGDSRLTRMMLANAAGAIDWTFQLSPYKSIPHPAKLNGAYQVAKFDDMLGEAKAKTPAAAKLLKKVYAYYEPGRKLAYRVTEGGASTDVFYSPDAMAQSDAVASWVFESGSARILVKKENTVYQGKAGRGRLVEAVSKAGSRFETLLRSLVIGRNPMRLLLNDECLVSEKGSGTAGSDSCTILGVTSAVADYTVTVSKADGFVYRIASRPKDARGNVLLETTQEFTRLSFSAMPRTVKGAKTDDLTKLAPAETPNTLGN